MNHAPCRLSVSKYELNKRWLVFYASTLGAAYLYLRPFIRRKLGSAQRFRLPQAQPSRSASSVILPVLVLVHAELPHTDGCCCRGYINLYSLYIAWLASAIFIHMPSFESLGLDVRADVSMLLVTFVVTLGVLGVLHGARQHPRSPCCVAFIATNGTMHYG